MSKVIAGITMLVDGDITGPDDGPAAASESAASGCTTGYSADPGATNYRGGVNQPDKTRSGSMPRWPGPA